MRLYFTFPSQCFAPSIWLSVCAYVLVCVCVSVCACVHVFSVCVCVSARVCLCVCICMLEIERKYVNGFHYVLLCVHGPFCFLGLSVLCSGGCPQVAFFISDLSVLRLYSQSSFLLGLFIYLLAFYISHNSSSCVLTLNTYITFSAHFYPLIMCSGLHVVQCILLYLNVVSILQYIVFFHIIFYVQPELRVLQIFISAYYVFCSGFRAVYSLS